MPKHDTHKLYLSDRQVAERYSVTRNTIWTWSREGDFPTPHKLSERCSRWRLDEIEAWESERQGVA